MALLEATRSSLLESFVTLGIDLVQIPQVMGNLEHSIDCCRQIEGEVAAELGSSVIANKISVVLMGSYGRLEASKLSDVDYLLIASEELDKGSEAMVKDKLKAIVERHQTDKVVLAEDRLFGKTLVVESLMKDIGGFKDVGESLTARMRAPGNRVSG